MTPRRTRTARAAFTLLEVLLVVVILGVFAAVAVPRLSGTVEREALDGAARRMRALAHRCRAEAAAHGMAHRLVLDLDARRVRVERELHPGSGRTTWDDEDDRIERARAGWEPVPAPWARDLVLPDGVHMVQVAYGPAVETGLLRDPEERPVLPFHADGSAVDCEITLEGADGRTVVLAARGLTGRLALRGGDEDPAPWQLSGPGTDEAWVVEEVR